MSYEIECLKEKLEEGAEFIARGRYKAVLEELEPAVIRQIEEKYGVSFVLSARLLIAHICVLANGETFDVEVFLGNDFSYGWGSSSGYNAAHDAFKAGVEIVINQAEEPG